MRKYEIVCVDDEEAILELYEVDLSGLGHAIVTFTNPKDAIDYITSNQNKVIGIISDYKMPEINGLEFREELLNRDIYTPFLMVTGFYNKEMALKGMELKVSKFIQKPYDDQELVEFAKSDAEKLRKVLEEEFDMIRSFVEESYPMIEEIEDLILQLEDDPNDINCLNTYFRLLHTIKGTASCVGLVSLPNFTHKYEDLVTELKHGHIKVNNQIIDILLSGLDVLKNMYHSISSGESFEFDIESEIKIFDLENIKKNSLTDVNQDPDFESTSEAKIKKSSKKEEEEKLGINISLLDDFMELSGEITVLRNMVLKTVSKIESRYQGDRDIDVLSESLDEMHKVSSLLQNQISEMRKVNLSSIYRPLKRVVRDTSKKLGKDVELKLVGEELRVDTSVGRVLSNTLVHLVRNGIDHGIETIVERKAIGKPVTGNLEIRTEIDNDYINLHIVDDGNGIDPEKLKHKAIEKSLCSEEELNTMTKQKILALIFNSGFSTAEQVTDISGRGVGMDMVKSSIESIDGRIYIDSNVGKGTTFFVQIPIPRSVLIIKSLMVKIGGAQFATPLDDVAEVININEKNKLEYINDSLILKHSNTLIPIIDLRCSFNENDCHKDYEEKSVVIVETEAYRYGLLVDQVQDIEEVVVKKLVNKLQQENVMFQGATLIGDGEMALIFDLEKIAQYHSIHVEDAEKDFDFAKEEVFVNFHEEFVLVDLWNTKSDYCIPLKNVSRLEEFKLSDIDYSGNLPIYRYRDNFLPIVFGNSIDGHNVKYPEELNVVVINSNGSQIGLVVESIVDIVRSKENIDSLFKTSRFIDGTLFIDGKTLSVLNCEVLVETKNNSKLLGNEEIKNAA